MNAAVTSLIALVFLILAINFIVVFMRYRRDFPRKTKGKASEEDEAIVLRDLEIKHRIEREQDAAQRYVDSKNRTLDLYAEVRKRAAEADELAQNRKTQDRLIEDADSDDDEE